MINSRRFDFRVCALNIKLKVFISSCHYSDVITSVIASQINCVSIVWSTICWRAHQRKHLSSASLAFVRGFHLWLADFPAQRDTNAKNVYIWWRHHIFRKNKCILFYAMLVCVHVRNIKHGLINTIPNFIIWLLSMIDSHNCWHGNPHWDMNSLWCLICIINLVLFYFLGEWVLIGETKQVFVSKVTQIAKFMGSTWGPPGSCRPQLGPMLAPWTLLSGKSLKLPGAAN